MNAIVLATFQHECRLFAALDDLHIPKVYDYFSKQRGVGASPVKPLDLSEEGA